MIKRFIDIIFMQKPAFSDLQKDPTYSLFLAVLVASTSAIFVWHYSILDYQWFNQVVLQQEKGQQIVDRSMLLTTATGVAVVGMLLITALGALYLFIVGKAIGLANSYTSWFAFSVWTSSPQLLVVFLMAVRLATAGSGQVAPDELQMVSLNDLIFDLPYGHEWRGLAASLSLSTVWQIALMIFGFGVWAKRSLFHSAVVVLTPYLAIYGVWVLILLNT